MNVCPEYHINPSASCRNILLKPHSDAEFKVRGAPKSVSVINCRHNCWSSSNWKVAGSNPPLSWLHVKVSLSKKLNPKYFLFRQDRKERGTLSLHKSAACSAGKLCKDHLMCPMFVEICELPCPEPRLYCGWKFNIQWGTNKLEHANKVFAVWKQMWFLFKVSALRSQQDSFTIKCRLLGCGGNILTNI